MKIKSLGDLDRGNKDHQAAAWKCLRNLGCEHLAHDGEEDAITGLYGYWESMVGEYGQDESDAEDGIVEEFNLVNE